MVLYNVKDSFATISKEEQMGGVDHGVASSLVSPMNELLLVEFFLQYP